MNAALKVCGLKIRNIMGVSEYEFSPGAGFTELLGPNGVGKTSILESFKKLGRGGHDATLLTTGAASGEIVYVLDDGFSIEMSITEASTQTTVRDSKGKKQPRPDGFIRSLVDPSSINPIQLLYAEPKERVKMILEAMPIVADCDRLTKIAGFEVQTVQGVSGLYIIDQTRQLVFDARTGTNRAAKEKAATIKQLTEVMPAAVDGVSMDEEVLRAELAAIDAERQTEFLRVDSKLESLVGATADRVEQIRKDSELTIQELQQQIDQLKEKRAADIAEEQEKLTYTKGLAAAQKQRFTEQLAARSAPINAQITLITANRESVAKREQALRTIETMETEHALLADESEKQTEAIAQIDAYKLELLASLPVPGLEIRGDKIYRDNVPFDRLNTQQRVDIAVDIAKLRPGRLGLICMDGMEVMDTEHYEAFKARQAAEPNLQFVLARVTDDQFTVRTA